MIKVFTLIEQELDGIRVELQEPEFELSGLKSGLKIVRTLAQARKPFLKSNSEVSNSQFIWLR